MIQLLREATAPYVSRTPVTIHPHDLASAADVEDPDRTTGTGSSRSRGPLERRRWWSIGYRAQRAAGMSQHLGRPRTGQESTMPVSRQEDIASVQSGSVQRVSSIADGDRLGNPSMQHSAPSRCQRLGPGTTASHISLYRQHSPFLPSRKKDLKRDICRRK